MRVVRSLAVPGNAMTKKNATPSHDLALVSGRFRIDGEFVMGGRYGSGHINDTYAVTFNEAGGPVRYILQRINHDVFRQPGIVMSNIERVTRHVRAKLEGAGEEDIDRRTLTLIPTMDGTSCHVDAEGNHWRMYVFIERAQTYDEIRTAEQAFEEARAFGLFLRQLSDLPGEPLVETIPDFHNTRKRFDDLQAAIGEDVCNRAAGVQAEIEFACGREHIVDVLVDLQRKGELPTIVTHNDTKLNNVMIDDATGEGICVIDLDTVMPGLSLYDFGDMVRTAARPCAEDAEDPGKARARMDLFEACVRGYLASTGSALNRAEKDHMAFSAKLITLEIGMRFLTDYLQGDVYFRTQYPDHNLRRTRVLLALTRSFEELEDDMNRLVDRISREG